MKQILIISTIFILLLSSCKNDKKQGVLDEKTYKNVLKELILTNVVRQQLEKKDTTAKYLISLVYKKYNVDSIQLKESTDYYSNHPEILAAIYKEIHQELKEKADSLNLINPNKKALKTDKITISKEALKQSKK